MVLVGKFTQPEVKRSLLRVGKKLKWIVPRSQWVQIDSEGSLVLMAERLERTSMSVLKCASSPLLNLFATYVKEILSPSTKNTVTELLINSLSTNSI